MRLEPKLDLIFSDIDMAYLAFGNALTGKSFHSTARVISAAHRPRVDGFAYYRTR